jgi:hypothetical protein
MKKYMLIMLLCISFVFAGCDDDTKPTDADKDQARKTATAMQEANRQVGMPGIVNYQEKKLAKMLYELRDQEGILCYAYLKSLDGKAVYLGKCIGYGLPYCVQFSNPERIVHQTTYSGGSFGTLPQPEPNGLFMPQTLSATWLMMVDPATGDPRPVYIEPEILVSPFPLPNAVGAPSGVQIK